jgi:hypothetical protein
MLKDKATENVKEDQLMMHHIKSVLDVFFKEDRPYGYKDQLAEMYSMASESDRFNLQFGKEERSDLAESFRMLTQLIHNLGEIHEDL